MSRGMGDRGGLSVLSLGLIVVDLLLFLAAILAWEVSAVFSCVMLVAFALLTMGLMVRPAYAYYDLTHWGLTVKSIERLSTGGVTYSCWKEINEFLGPKDLRPPGRRAPSRRPGR